MRSASEHSSFFSLSISRKNVLLVVENEISAKEATSLFLFLQIIWLLQFKCLSLQQLTWHYVWAIIST